MSLAELAQTRVAMNMPDFPGASLAEKLVNGRNAALEVLRRYVPDFSYDVAAADACIRHINAWADRNEEKLSEAMRSTGRDLPEEIRTELGPGQAQAFILANFTKAAEGLGPWHAGEVDRVAVTPGGRVGTVWAVEDAQRRLQVFGSVIVMEQNGKLAELFAAASVGADALGLVWLVPLLIAAVIVAAIVVNGVVDANKIAANNKLMADICRDAQARGDQVVVQSCVEATRDLQAPSPSLLEGVAGKVITAAAIVGAIYLGIRYGLPWVEAQLEKRKSHRGSAVERAA